MLCAVYVTYTTSRGKVFRDRVAHNLLLADAEELMRRKQGRGYDRIEITWPIRRIPSSMVPRRRRWCGRSPDRPLDNEPHNNNGG
jgi:hypothetical protein